MCSVHLGKLQEAGSADWARRRPRTTGRPVHACGCAVVPAMCDHDDKMRHGGHSIGPHPCPDGQQTSVEPARSGLMCCCSRWLALTHSSSYTHTHTIALPKDLTCGIERATRSVPTSPASGHQTAGTDCQWSKNEGKQGQPSLARGGRWFFWVHPPNQRTKVSPPHSLLPILARAMSKFTQQVRRYVPRPAGRNYLTSPQHSGKAPPGLLPWEGALTVNQQDQREC